MRSIERTNAWLLSAAFMLCAEGMGAANIVTDPLTVQTDSSRVIDIDEVVVVSQPKELFRLRMQPLSSTSLGPRQLGSIHATGLRDLSAVVPSFVMPQYGSRLTSAIYVRGIGSRINNPAVGLYYDGLPILGKAAYNTHFYQTERVDVLRGPQGTLYGLNTEGGLMKVYTRSPFSYQGTDISIGAGTRFYRNAEVSHYAHFGDRAALSLSAFYNGQNGFLRNSFLDKRADDIDEYGGRVRLMLRPTAHLTADIIADYQHTRQDGFAYGELDGQTGRVASPSAGHLGSYKRDMLNTGLILKYAANGLELSSTTSWQYLNDHMFMDQDYVSDDFMTLRQSQLQHSIAEELSLKGTACRWWRWTVGGLFSYQWLKTTAPVGFGEAFTRPIATRMQGVIYDAIVGSMATRFNPTPGEADYARARAIVDRAGGVSVGGLSMDVPGAFHTPMLNVGLFHESGFRIGDRLTVSAGLRYDSHEVRADYDTRAVLSMTASVMGTEATRTLTSALASKVAQTYRQLLPKLSVTWLTDRDGSNLYAVVSKGYRAGGFNIQMFSDILQTEIMQHGRMLSGGDYEVKHDQAAYERVRNTISYKPETIWNYEVGMHANLFGGSMQLDLAAFYTRIGNQQLSVMASDYGFGRMMVNAGRSRSCGMELSVRGSALDDRLSWTASYGLTHATFRDYTDSVRVDGRYTPVSYAGKRVPFVPMHTIGAAADYRLPLTSGAVEWVTFGLNMTATGSIYWDEANTYRQRMYAVVGAHADVKVGRATISLWGKNLTDTRYSTFAVGNAATGQTRWFAQRGMPIQAGVDVRMSF